MNSPPGIHTIALGQGLGGQLFLRLSSFFSDDAKEALESDAIVNSINATDCQLGSFIVQFSLGNSLNVCIVVDRWTGQTKADGSLEAIRPACSCSGIRPSSGSWPVLRCEPVLRLAHLRVPGPFSVVVREVGVELAVKRWRSACCLVGQLPAVAGCL